MAEYVSCNTCGTGFDMEEEGNACPECGAVLNEEMPEDWDCCNSCGACVNMTVREPGAICPECGGLLFGDE